MRRRWLVVLAPIGVLACNAILGLDGDTRVVPGNGLGGDGASSDGPSSASSGGDGSSSGSSGSGELKVLLGEVGGSGYADGPFNVARFTSLRAIAADLEGNIYVIDDRYVIRKIAAGTHDVSTIAGNNFGKHDIGKSGPGLDSRFINLAALACDPIGKILYATDTQTCQLHQIDLADAQYRTTFLTASCGRAAGIVPNAQLDSPVGLAWSGVGTPSLYISDETSIRRFEPGSNYISGFCGSLADGGSESEGSCASGTLIVSSAEIATPSSTGFPLHIRTPSGRLRDITLGNIKTDVPLPLDGGPVPTTGPYPFPTHAGFAVRRDGTAVLVGAKTMIWQVPYPTTPAVVAYAGKKDEPGWADGALADARFEGIGGITPMPGVDNEFLVADQNTVRLLKSNSAQTIAGRGRVWGYGEGTGKEVMLGPVKSMTRDGNGHVFFYDATHATVRRLDVASGAVTKVAGQVDTPGILDSTDREKVQIGDGGVGIVFDGTSIILSDSTPLIGPRIRKIDPNTGATSTLNAPSPRALGMAFASDLQGTIYTTSPDGHALETWRAAQGSFQVIAGVEGGGGAGSTDGPGTEARFLGIEGLCYDASINAIFASDRAKTIRRIQLGDAGVTVVTTVAGSANMMDYLDAPGADARFDQPEGIACDGAGHVYVAEVGRATLRRIDIATGDVKTIAGSMDHPAVVAGSLPAGLNAPTSPIFLANGHILVGSANESVIIDITPPK